MDSIQYLAPFIQAYGYLVVFLGAAFFGETIIFAAIFLSFFGYLNFYLIILVSLCGVIFSDTCWYLAGYLINPHVTGRRQGILSRRLNAKIDYLKSQFRQDHNKFLVYSKFIYGLRIIVLLSAGYERLAYKRFLAFNLLGNFCWVLLVILIGSGMRFTHSHYQHYDYYWLYLAVSVFCVLWLISWCFNKVLLSDYERRD